MNTVIFGIENYYGKVKAYEIDGKFYIGLENYCNNSEVEISEKLWEALVEEFGLSEE